MERGDEQRDRPVEYANYQRTPARSGQLRLHRATLCGPQWPPRGVPGASRTRSRTERGNEWWRHGTAPCCHDGTPHNPPATDRAQRERTTAGQRRQNGIAPRSGRWPFGVLPAAGPPQSRPTPYRGCSATESDRSRAGESPKQCGRAEALASERVNSPSKSTHTHKKCLIRLPLRSVASSLRIRLKRDAQRKGL
uniref:Uncharacterized protein n=1 Tax=Anopheles dirus TaxID=7168 RepID=A0A1Y9H2K5_9DIPT